MLLTSNTSAVWIKGILTTLFTSLLISSCVDIFWESKYFSKTICLKLNYFYKTSTRYRIWKGKKKKKRNPVNTFFLLPTSRQFFLSKFLFQWKVQDFIMIFTKISTAVYNTCACACICICVKCWNVNLINRIFSHFQFRHMSHNSS